MVDAGEGVVLVEVCGRQYPIRSGLDETYVTELARYVDRKIRTTAKHAHGADSLQVAVLAALNIADEYFRYRNRQPASPDDVRRRTDELEALVDRAIADSVEPDE
ncbi:MAG: cell division protein ZapA [Acidobacteria bacterium]|nr:cell division protein ZapA [Acidobacteriota bacterium]